MSTNEFARLSPPAQAAYRILMGSDPRQVDADMAALPTGLRAEFDALEISHAIGQIRAPIFLLNDANDTSIAFTESRAFDEALTRLHHSHRFVEFHIFDHVQMRGGA